MSQGITGFDLPVAIGEQDTVRVNGSRIRINNPRHDLPVALFIIAGGVLTILSLIYLNLDWSKIIQRMPKLITVLRDMTAFSTERFSITLTTLMETVTVTILATIYGLVLGLLVGALAARNITPWRPLSTLLHSFFAFIRAVPTPVWVLLILACLGFGMAAGIVGLCFHVVAFFGRVFAQTFEEVSEGTIEALRATGANRIQVFFGAVLPASITGLIAWSALRFEINFSGAAILGMVGAGGIGYTIMAAMNSYKLGRAGMAVLIVFGFALLMEVTMTVIKRKLKV